MSIRFQVIKVRDGKTVTLVADWVRVLWREPLSQDRPEEDRDANGRPVIDVEEVKTVVVKKPKR